MIRGRVVIFNLGGGIAQHKVDEELLLDPVSGFKRIQESERYGRFGIRYVMHTHMCIYVYIYYIYTYCIQLLFYTVSTFQIFEVRLHA